MNAIPDSLAALRVPIEGLLPYGKNPRVGNVDAIAESLEVNGQYRPVVVNKRTNEVLAGNHTLKAAKRLGWTEIAATFVDADEEQAARIVLVDNRSNDGASYDDSALADLLQSLDDLAGTGFSNEDLTELLADVTELPPALADPDAVPETPTAPQTEVGDVWILGPHRLACGDSTSVDVFDALLGEAKVDLVWTDPPYGVDYVGKTADALTIESDGAAGLADLLHGSLGAAFVASKPGAAWYVAFADKTLLQLLTVLTDLGVYRQTIIWAKDRFVLGRGDYHSRHEPILYGWHPGAARLQPVEDRTQDTLWEIPRPSASKDHPTMKPVALITRAIENSSSKGALVLDPFGGSGSTLIAAHATGRRARLIELDPRYADVICRRYQEATGDKPVLEATGEPHDFTD